MKRSAIQYLFSAPAAMLYTLAASGLHENLGAPRGPSAIVAALASYIFVTSLGLWVLADAARRQRTLPYDFGSFVFFAWLLVVPLYLWSTRRWRAFIPLLLFALLYLLAILISSIPHWI